MVNIKRNYILCKIHDISHSKKSGCKKCKLNIDNYDTSSKHMQDKIFKNFHNDLIEKIKKKFTNHNIKEIYTNILNNSTDKKIIKLKLIEVERDRLDYVRNLKLNKSDYPIKYEVNDLYNITINLNKSIRKIYNRFKEINYKYITDYIENEINIDTMEYKILKKKINSMYLKIKEIIKNIKEADNKKYKEDLEKRKLKEKENLNDYDKNQEKMKTYNKEVLRYVKNSNEPIYTCAVCKLEKDYSLDLEEQQHVMKDHFKLKLHKDNFNEKISIKINKSIEGKFVDIIFDFKDLITTTIYEDLYLKKIMKEKVNENAKKNKKYKRIILKIYTKHSDLRNIMENIITAKVKTHDVIKSIDNLEYLELTKLNLPEDKSFLKYARDTVIKNYDEYIKSEKYKKTVRYLKDNNISEEIIKKHTVTIHDYFLNKENKNNLKKLKESIIELDNKTRVTDNKMTPSEYEIAVENIVELGIGSGMTIEIGNGDDEPIYQSLRCVIKMTEYAPISGGNISELNKIPDLFLNKRSLLILKNNDNKCFLYCYIREILNLITKNRFRITKRDKELANEVINETNLNFENVSISEIDKIEKKLKVNVNVFSCNKNYKNKNPVRKSRENHDKTLDLLLIEDINHYIIIKNLHCSLTDRCSEKDNFICRICLNIFYSEIKYNEHMNYCKTRKPQRLMPSNEKHIKFNKLQNCMLNNFVIYSDFECIIDKNSERKFISGGYLVKCRNDKFTKPVQIFDDLDDYCENLKNELKYIEKTNNKHLNYKIDRKTFDKEKFNKTTHCEYCNYKFDKDYNDRKIELYERVDKNKLKYIIDNYDFNEETENTLKLYYESLNKKGQKKVIYKQSKENKNRYFGGICLTTIK